MEPEEEATERAWSGKCPSCKSGGLQKTNMNAKNNEFSPKNLNGGQRLTSTISG